MGAYYGHELEAAENENRITKNVYDKTLQVHTAWDLGHSDATAIWFYQQQGFEIRIIDFYFATGHALDHYVTELQEQGRISPPTLAATSTEDIISRMTWRSKSWAAARPGLPLCARWACRTSLSSRSSMWMKASTRCARYFRAAGLIERNARTASRRCGSTGATRMTCARCSTRSPTTIGPLTRRCLPLSGDWPAGPRRPQGGRAKTRQEVDLLNHGKNVGRGIERPSWTAGSPMRAPSTAPT